MRALLRIAIECAIAALAGALIFACLLISYACSAYVAPAPAVIPSIVYASDDARYCALTADETAALPAGVRVPDRIADCVTDAECEAAWLEVCR